MKIFSKKHRNLITIFILMGTLLFIYQNCADINVIALNSVNSENILDAEKKLSAGLFHTCAILEDKTLRCWGANRSGELGNGATTNSNVPVQVSNAEQVNFVSAGWSQTCSLQNNQSVQCWGFNALDTNLNNVTILTDNCAIHTDHSVSCWGSNLYGQIGNGSTTSTPMGGLPPTQVSQIQNARSISSGYYHTCAVLADQTLQCWGLVYAPSTGYNPENPLNFERHTPTAINGIENAVAVSAGANVTCALHANNTIKCFGQNQKGQLGNGTLVDVLPNTDAPTTVVGIDNALSVSTGGNSACAVLKNGSIKCWGENMYGQLGNNTTQSSSTPVLVSGITNAAAVSVGDRHACALLTDKTVKCWGGNEFGQLGDGTFTHSSVPVTAHNIP